MTRILRLFVILLAILVFMVSIFAVDQAEVSLSFLEWQSPPVSVFWWLLGAFVLGATVGIVGAGLATIKRSFEHRSLRRELDRNNAELRQLRSASLHD